jgi:hypothetical protein
MGLQNCKNSNFKKIRDSQVGSPKTKWHLSATLMARHKEYYKGEGDGCRNPTLAKCGGEAQHLEKLEVWSPPGLLNV